MDKRLRFKIGDKVEVVGNSSTGEFGVGAHRFNIGDIVTIKEEFGAQPREFGLDSVYLPHYRAESQDGKDCYIEDIDCKSVTTGRLKPGDIVEITSNLAMHQFTIGEKVKILVDQGYNYKAVSITDRGCAWFIMDGEYKLVKDNKIETMKPIEQSIYDVAVNLLKANNTVTTLEIKNELRKTVPGKWFQSDISDVMEEFNQKGIFDYTDNGTYRVYSNVQDTLTTTVTTPKGSQTTKFSKITKLGAVNLIKNSKGKFFTVVFTKKDNTQRTMNCQYHKTQNSALGYILVKDIAGKSVKNVNSQTIKELRINGTNYIVN